MLKVDLSLNNEDDQSGKPDTDGGALFGESFAPAEPEGTLLAENVPQFDLGPEELLNHIAPEITPAAPPDAPEAVPAPVEEDDFADVPDIPSDDGEESGTQVFATGRRAPDQREKVPLSDRLPDSPVAIPVPSGDAGTQIPEPPRKKSGWRIAVALVVIVLAGVVGAAFYFGSGRITLPELSLPAVSLPDMGAIGNRIAGLLPKKTPAPVPAPAQSEPAAAAVPDSTASVTEETSLPPEEPAVPAGPEKAAEPAKPVEAAVSPAQPPKPVPSPPVPVAGRDAVLVTLRRIGQLTPPRVWLTTVTAGTGGAYEARGLAFSHAALGTFVSALEKAGALSGKDLPPSSSAPDAVYQFSLAGTLNGAVSAGPLAPLSPEETTAFVKKLRVSGVTLTRLPSLGQTYGDGDLPFEVEGAYAAVSARLAGVLSGGRYVVYRAAIQPLGGDVGGNRVRMAFSVRMSAK